MNIHNLVAQDIPLQGKHLIEASAGTGKTYNITRLYLRLLLEKELSVQQILVMTFTKDATEELRSRIDSVLRDTVDNWQYLVETEDFFKKLASRVNHDKALLLLQQALVQLDEASIYTIHGFCKSVLSQHAFGSKVSFSSEMEANAQEQILQSTQDWYRCLAFDDEESYKLLSEHFAEPSGFIREFFKAINSDISLDILTPEDILLRYKSDIRAAKHNLESHKKSIFDCLVETKKGKAKETRIAEYEALVSWLEGVIVDHENASIKMPTSFFSGVRFSKHERKAELVEIFLPLNNIKNAKKSIFQQLHKAKFLELARLGVLSIRKQVNKAKVAANLLTFDDLIATLESCLSEKGNSNTLAQTLFEQFPVALVDEFQDTDPKQFSIIKSLYFKQEKASLFMIGDPKQAIYGFRGGDVFAYLAARKFCDYQWLMDTNWRSNNKVISGYNQLFSSPNEQPTEVFGYGIPYYPVNASPAADEKTLVDQEYSAIQFVHFDKGDAKKVTQAHRSLMASWGANEAKRLLKEATISANDIAFLVRDGGEAADIKKALVDVGLSSVYLSDRQNLFTSDESKELVRILKGLLFIENERLFNAMITSSLFDYSAGSFQALTEDQHAWQTLKFSFIELREVWLNKGFITMALKMMHDHINVDIENSDRILTNLLHLFELVQSASQRFRQPHELLAWLEQQMRSDNPDSEAELRLESEDNLIKIVTQHGSKGLEYPIVFVPFVTRYKDPLRIGNKPITLISYHDEEGKQRLSFDATLAQKTAMSEESFAETIRLLYVAVTRAEKRCYLLTAEFDNYHLSPLGQTLKWQKQDEIANSLQHLASTSDTAIGFTLADNDVETSISKTKEITTTPISVAKFTGKIERDWWMSSFTALNRNIRQSTISSPDRDLNEPLSTEEVINTDNLRFELEKGAKAGNLLHDILENLVFSNPNWEEASQWPLSKFGDLPTPYQESDLFTWLEEIISTPLTNKGEAATAFSLKMLEGHQTLREVEFYFPLNNAAVNQLTHTLMLHRANNKKHFNQQGIESTRQVHLPNLQQLKGMMHGFIDLVFEQGGKYYVADYKSTFLGSDLMSYEPIYMHRDIEQHNYDLQYLIYAVALHRYLSIVVPDYSIEEHFGGVYYFYLRGMNIQDGKTYGVYYSKISSEILMQLDEVFKGQEMINE